jgi:hypothetical protein
VIDLDFDCSWQAMLKRNEGTRIGVNCEFDSHPSVPDLIGNVDDRSRNGPVLSPREACEAHACGLARSDAS